MSNFTFTANSITVSGKTYPAAYSVTPSGAVMAFVTTPDAEDPQRVRFAPDHPDHAAALAAAQAEKAAHEAEAVQAAQETTTEAAQAASIFPGWDNDIHQTADQIKRRRAGEKIKAKSIKLDKSSKCAIIQGHAAKPYTATLTKCTCGDFIRYRMPCKHMYRLAEELGLFDTSENAAEPVQEQPEAPTTDAAQAAQEVPTTDAAHAEPEAPTTQNAPAPVPIKDFIGQTITGNGWRIFFDGEAGRTRVIFDAAPTDAARAALEKAGFYFSSVMNSYNKKLTHKAHRAAVALSGELGELYA